MKKIEHGFIIDRLTDSILNTISGDSFQTEVATLKKSDLRNILKKNGWNFNWRKEFNDLKKEVYKLTIVNNPEIIQGLLSITVESDHIFMNLLESAPFNIGRKKLYEGVAGNLVAYACKTSFQKGHDGFVAFTAKTKLIKHYEETLGAYHFMNQRMIIDTEAAKFLVGKYFKTNSKMGHIKEPKGVDFLIESKPLTDTERKKISEFIKRRKELTGKGSSTEKKPGKRKKASV